MQNDNNNRPRLRLHNTSIDGIVNTRPNSIKHLPKEEIDRHDHRSSSTSIQNTDPADKSLRPPSGQTSPLPSMLNLTIPGRVSGVNQPLQEVKKKRSWKNYAKKSTLALLLILLLGGGWIGWKFYRNIAKLTHNNNPFAAIASALNQVNLKNENNWVNVLVAGYDPSDGDITTDTIMVVSVNKITNQAIMLSIPRDTWVNNLPGFGHQKINASEDIANFNQPGYLKGGMGELEQQIHDKLGITSDYYVLVNNAAFKEGVNIVGGIDINIQSPDPRGLYDPNIDAALGGPLKITNGWHHLDGLQALALVKSRGDSPYSYGFPNSDFDREAHARQVVVAMKNKALTAGVLANPAKLGQLLDTVGANVQTDVTLSDAQGFYSLMKKVNNNNIKSLSLESINGQKLLTGQVINGLDVEVPTAGVDNFSQIQSEVRSLYSTDPVIQEAATVVLLNGSNVDGLAKQEETTLINDGFIVVGTGDPNSVYPSSMIIDQSNGKDPASKQALIKLFSTGTTYTTSTDSPAEATEAKNYTANFVIVLGQNWNSATTSNN